MNGKSTKSSTTDVIMQHIAASGFPRSCDLIHVFIGGSQLHGAKLHGTDDLDIYGVYVEPPELVVGLDSMEHFVWSTSGDERRNGPDDVDVTLYSLRKWARLATKGNPTALHFLFSGESLPGVWADILARRDVFLARSATREFLGFADNQLKRMQGLLGRGKKGQRPEIEAQFGFDVKAAMHAIRLLYECLELVTVKRITLPRPERELLIRTRRGDFTLQQVLDMSADLFQKCAEAEKNSALPATISRAAVSKLVAEAYQKHWEQSSAR